VASSELEQIQLLPRQASVLSAGGSLSSVAPRRYRVLSEPAPTSVQVNRPAIDATEEAVEGGVSRPLKKADMKLPRFVYFEVQK
jgi:hypothetical protein